MKFDIKNRYNDQILYSGEGETLAVVVTKAVKEGANLEGANLEGAYLVGAYLVGAYLVGAYLARANLEGANLEGAYLVGAYLEGAYLEGAYLARANLEGAYLVGAYLEGANDFPYHKFRICPEGTIIGWKKMACGNILQLEIPVNAKRVNAIGSRKCRAEFALPIAVYNKDQKLVTDYGKLVSKHDSNFTYKIGKECKPDSFNDSVTDECSNGIHFFITFEEARDY